MEVMANLINTTGEEIVLAVCKVAPIKFGDMKMIFDVTRVCIAIVLSRVFLGRIVGGREGTITAAVLVDKITKQTNKLMKRIEGNMLCRILRIIRGLLLKIPTKQLTMRYIDVQMKRE